MTRDEAFSQLVNASDEWTQKQQQVLNKIYDDFESESLMDNDLLPITYEAGRQAGKDSMKSEIAKAYMEGSESGRESMEELL